jgi:hypothetical protein
MVDKDQQILNFVKRRDVRNAILQAEFPEEYYTRIKTEYFSGFLRNKIGKPRDSEIAKAALDLLFKEHYFKSKDQLYELLQRKFFSRNIFDREFYFQKFAMTQGMNSEPIENQGSRVESKHTTQQIDQKIEETTLQVEDKRMSVYDSNESLPEQQVEIQKIEENPEEPRKQYTRQEIHPLIEDKRNETKAIYESNEPLLDQEVDKHVPLREIRDIQRRLEPWWKTLGLTSDPFPSMIGLEKIKHSLYDCIIVFTELYERYVNYINNYPNELFKNIVLYGAYGSGKTTLFEYLKILLFKKKIYPALIGIDAVADYQNFLMKFKRRLREELEGILNILGGPDLTTTLDSMGLDASLPYLFKLIQQNDKCNGFVIFIDNIYKPQGYEKTALKFLNHLQTFKDELAHEICSGNIGFFISAPPDWDRILKNQAYSGSITLEEHMRPPTVIEASNMFNLRLAAFATDKEKYREIAAESADQIYRTLKLRNEPITFRGFITECLNRLRRGNFDILTSNPVSITRETLNGILWILKGIPKLNYKINEILDLSISMRDKGECLELLVDIFNKKGLTEEAFQNKYYFNILRDNELIVKSTNDSGKTIWNISNDLLELNKRVNDKFDYYLDDYFLKLFEDKIEVKKIEISTSDSEEEFIEIQKLIDHFSSRTDVKGSSIRRYLKDARSFHNDIVDMDIVANPGSLISLTKKCKASIKSISNAVAKYSDMDASDGYELAIHFWDDYWQYPESLRSFTKALDKQSQSYEPDRIALLSVYGYAFTDIVKLFLEQVRKDKILPIPFIGLKSEEIKEFDKARISYEEGDLSSAVGRIAELIEIKMREFIYSVFLLQYGDPNNRRVRIPPRILYDIRKRENIDTEKGDAINKNEFTYLNRNQYSELIAGRDGIGYDNWEHSFSKIFTRSPGWDIFKVRSYLNTFTDFHLKDSHNRPDYFTNRHQPVYEFIMDSIYIMILINQSYFLFLERVKKAEIPGSTTIGYYFYLSGGTPQPVRVSQTNRMKIVELFNESPSPISIDFSRPSELQERFRINYQELFAILYDLLSETPTCATKRNGPSIDFRLK